MLFLKCSKLTFGLSDVFVVTVIAIARNCSERKRAGDWILVGSAGPGLSAWVDSKTKMAAA